MSLQLPAPETVRLADGFEITIRPIQPSDAPALQRGFTELSSDSIFFRFLEHRSTLSDAEANELATVDYTTRMAFVAIEPEGNLIAVARYGLIDPHNPTEAESAIIVGDQFQGRGVGRVLFARLIEYARQQGVQFFIANIHANNQRIMRFIEQYRLPLEKHLDGAVWTVRITLKTPQLLAD